MISAHYWSKFGECSELLKLPDAGFPHPVFCFKRSKAFCGCGRNWGGWATPRQEKTPPERGLLDENTGYAILASHLSVPKAFRQGRFCLGLTAPEISGENFPAQQQGRIL